MNIEDLDFDSIKEEELDFTLADHWIISRLNKIIIEVDEALEKYNFEGSGKTFMTLSG